MRFQIVLLYNIVNTDIGVPGGKGTHFDGGPTDNQIIYPLREAFSTEITGQILSKGNQGDPDRTR
jgi:hypothetical protein